MRPQIKLFLLLLMLPLTEQTFHLDHCKNRIKRISVLHFFPKNYKSFTWIWTTLRRTARAGRGHVARLANRGYQWSTRLLLSRFDDDVENGEHNKVRGRTFHPKTLEIRRAPRYPAAKVSTNMFSHELGTRWWVFIVIKAALWSFGQGFEVRIANKFVLKTEYFFYCQLLFDFANSLFDHLNDICLVVMCFVDKSLFKCYATYMWLW